MALLRFLIVGVGSNILNLVIYLLVHAVGGSLLLASSAGYVVGLLNSFHFGRTWVFEGEKRASARTIALFAVVYLIGGIGMSTIIEVLERKVGLDYRLSWLCGALFAFINNFLGSKWVLFKGSEQNNGH
jgi:putative flippase GtrA